MPPSRGGAARSAGAEGADGDGRRRGAVLDAELGIDLLEMLVHRPRAEAQNLADVAIGLAAGDPCEDIGLARRQRKLLLEDALVPLRIALDQSQEKFVRADL